MTIMLDFQQKRKVRSFMYHKVTIGVLTVLLLFVVHSTWSVYQKKRTSEDLKNISAQYTEELRVRNEELKQKIERLETVVGIEEEIRSRFSVVKDDEKMVVIVPEEVEIISTTTESTTFWTKIRAFLRGAE